MLQNPGNQYIFSITDRIKRELCMAGADRIFYIADAFRFGFSLTEIYQYTKIDPWFLTQIEELIVIEKEVALLGVADAFTFNRLYFLKQRGFSDARLAALLNTTEEQIRAQRHALDIHPVYKRVDTCAGEFATETAYFYSTYQVENECRPTTRESPAPTRGKPRL